MQLALRSAIFFPAKIFFFSCFALQLNFRASTLPREALAEVLRACSKGELSDAVSAETSLRS
jgi:hypothetical protein